MQKINQKFIFYCVTQPNSSISSIKSACQGGVSFLQLREKNLPEQEYIKKATLVLKITQKYKIPLIINDQIKVFKIVNADGLHLGQNDLDAQTARKIIGPNKILGITVTNVKEAIKAQKDGADYLGVGAVFPTNTKNDATIVSMKIIKEIAKSVQIPVIAIGGLNSKNLGLLAKTKIKGLAFSFAIFHGNVFKNIERLHIEIKKHYQV